ncbi:MAG: LptF/LptG family permease [Deltaproteobacteria bacterium]|nr:LptF/LptG family permease [Deltaproteobacteria bacterium]
MLRYKIHRYFLRKISLYFLFTLIGTSITFVAIFFFEKLDTLVRFQGSPLSLVLVSLTELCSNASLIMLVCSSLTIAAFAFSISSSKEIKAFQALGYSISGLQDTVVFCSVILGLTSFLLFDSTQLFVKEYGEKMWKNLRGEKHELDNYTLFKSEWFVQARKFDLERKMFLGTTAVLVKNIAPQLLVQGRYGAYHHLESFTMNVSRAVALSLAKDLELKFLPSTRQNLFLTLPFNSYDLLLQTEQKDLIPVHLIKKEINRRQKENEVSSDWEVTLATKISDLVLGPIWAFLIVFFLATIKNWVGIFAYLLLGIIGTLTYLSYRTIMLSIFSLIKLNPLLILAASSVILATIHTLNKK